MYNPVDLNKKKADSLVIHCADPRFQAAFRSVTGGLEIYYDLLAVPGASKAVVNNPSIIDYIKLLASFHHFETIHVLDHVECGAFGPVNDELSEHAKMLAEAAREINKVMPKLTVVPHLLGETHELTVEV